MSSRTVNLRVVIPRTPQFGDSEGRERFELEIMDALDRQQVQYAVAPRQRVVGRLGVVLEAGAEVTLELLAEGDVAPSLRLARLIESGIVLNRDHRGGPPSAA